MTNDDQRFERANRLKLFLENLKLSGRDFAASIGMTQGAISNILNGKRAITIELVDTISFRHTGLNPGWLLFGQGTMLNSEQENRLVEENPPPYLKPRPIALQDLAEIILSIQEENKEMRKRLEYLERKVNGDETPPPSLP